MTTQTTSTTPTTTLPALRGETAVAAPNEWADFAPDGTEDIAPSFPIIKIVTATSKMSGANKHGGEFYRTDTEEFMPTIEGVPLSHRDTQSLFGNGLDTPLCSSPDGRAPLPDQLLWRLSEFTTTNGQTHNVTTRQPRLCAACPFNVWGENDEPPVCRPGVALLLYTDDELAVLRIPPSSLGTWKSFVSRRLKPKKMPLCSQHITLTTEDKSKGTKTWNQLVIQSETMTPAEASMFNAVLMSAMSNFERTIRDADAAEVGGMVIDGDEIDDLPFE